MFLQTAMKARVTVLFSSLNYSCESTQHVTRGVLPLNRTVGRLCYQNFPRLIASDLKLDQVSHTEWETGLVQARIKNK